MTLYCIYLFCWPGVAIDQVLLTITLKILFANIVEMAGKLDMG